MKRKYYLVFAFIFFIGMSGVKAQLVRIPASVVQALKEKYPDAKNINWKNKPGSFQATFTNSEKHLKAIFDMGGNWSETDETITEDALPAEVKDGLSKSKYATWKIKEVTRVEKPDNDPTYRLFVNGGSLLKKKNLTFSEKGELLKEAQNISL